MNALPCFKPLSKGVKIFAAGSLLLVLASAVTGRPFIGVGLEVLFKLCVGWMMFAVKTAPQIQMNPSFIANGLLGLLTGMLMLHAVLRALPGTPRPWRWKWTGAIVVMFVLLFGVCVGAIGIASHSALLFQEPLVLTHPSRVTVHWDKTHARQLAMHAQLAQEARSQSQSGTWANLLAHGDLDPDTLASQAVVRSLPPDEPPEVWTCLETVGEVPGSGLPVICAPRAHLPGRILVAFDDGQTRVCTIQEYEEAITRWHAARARMLSGGKVPEGGGAP